MLYTGLSWVNTIHRKVRVNKYYQSTKSQFIMWKALVHIINSTKIIAPASSHQNHFMYYNLNIAPHRPLAVIA